MASELWQRIRAARKVAGYTQEAFGALFEVSKAAVSQWESSKPSNRTRPDIDKLQQIAAITGAPLNWLMDDSADLEEEWWKDAEPDAGKSVPVVAAPALQPIHSWEYEDDLPAGNYAMVPRLDVKLSAGPGSGAPQLTFDFDDGQLRAYSADWIRKNHLKPKKLRVMRGSGRSMEPTVFDGDDLLINLAETEIVDGKVYALWYEGGERVKRLYRMPGGGIRIRSDNDREFPEIVLGPEYVGHVRIIGRVIDRSGPGGL